MSLRSRLKHIASMSLARLTSPLQGEFHSFADAADAAHHSTYEDSALVELVAAKTAAYRDAVLALGQPLHLSQSDLRFGVALQFASRGKSSLTVIDFGGACGAQYYLAKRLLGPDVSLSWKVVDTPTMTKVARNRFENSELVFFDALAAARRDTLHIDFVHSGNALQYLPSPIDTLKELLSVNATSVSLASVATCAREQQLFVLQRSLLSNNGPGQAPVGFRDGVIRYPFSPLSEPTVIALVRKHYKIEFCIEESRFLYHRACGRISYRNYLLRAPASQEARILS